VTKSEKVAAKRAWKGQVWFPAEESRAMVCRVPSCLIRDGLGSLQNINARDAPLELCNCGNLVAGGQSARRSSFPPHLTAESASAVHCSSQLATKYDSNKGGGFSIEKLKGGEEAARYKERKMK
jgi:hypothetical protein